MEKNAHEIIDQKLIALSDIMGVPVQFAPDESEQGKMRPVYDVNGILSKMLALFVYCGMSVAANCAPPYNRVHADIEWWKKEFATPDAPPAAEKTPDSEAQAAEEQPPAAAESPAAGSDSPAEAGSQ